MMEDLNNLVDDFMEKLEPYEKDLEKRKEIEKMFSSDEKEPVVMMGETAKPEDISDEI